MQIRFPSTVPGGDPVSFDGTQRFVLIGSNGSGKTRFGIWIEEQNQNSMSVHRIGAQKALSIPEFAPLMNSEQAEKNLFYGRADEHGTVGTKMNYRWSGQPATFLLSDFDKVLSLLFARTAERNARHTERTRLTKAYVDVPDSPIDLIVKVWGDLMPQRSIQLHDGKVLVNKGTSSEYHGKEMSDGERVALYLLGQCLCAPVNSVLIIDEPELHLHKSLMDKLWNRVEELCPDKTLIYITHDLDFAASRIDAKNLWIKSYEASKWQWVEVPPDTDFPENLVLELMGSRKPILFCEGERGGLDHTIYQLCYPHLHVVPRGGSDKVIESTRAWQANTALRGNVTFGLVDRDVRDLDECNALIKSGVQILEMAEVENLLCLPVVVELIAKQLLLSPKETQQAVLNFIVNSFNDEFETQVSNHADRRIRYHLSKYSKSSSNLAGLKKGLENLLLGLDVEAIHLDTTSKLKQSLDSQNSVEILKVYNRKSIASRISTCFGLKIDEYPTFVIRIMKSPDGKPILDALRASLPAQLGENFSQLCEQVASTIHVDSTRQESIYAHASNNSIHSSATV